MRYMELALSIFAFALDGVELAFAKTEGFGRDFEQFVVEEEVETLFKVELGVGRELDGAVGGVSTHVGELFFSTDVDVEVFFFVGEADNHALVDWDLRRDV